MNANNNKGPDWNARLKGADMTLKLANVYPGKHSAASHRHSHVHLALVKEMAKLPVEELIKIADGEDV